MTTTVPYADIETLAGADLGVTAWREVTQRQVDLFADATDDHQWIHTDPGRAAAGPFGGPIAHGYLTLSLVVPFSEELLQVEGVGTKVNYGLDRVRFPAPVRVGSRVRMAASVRDVAAVAGGHQLTVDATIEVEDGAKPAVVAVWLARFYA